MTAEQWLQANVPNKIEGDILRTMPDITTPIATFCTFFRDSLEDPEITDLYAALLGPHDFTWGGNPVTYTGEQLGYKPVFDLWRLEQVFGPYEEPGEGGDA